VQLKIEGAILKSIVRSGGLFFSFFFNNFSIFYRSRTSDFYYI